MCILHSPAQRSYLKASVLMNCDSAVLLATLLLDIRKVAKPT